MSGPGQGVQWLERRPLGLKDLGSVPSQGHIPRFQVHTPSPIGACAGGNHPQSEKSVKKMSPGMRTKEGGKKSE